MADQQFCLRWNHHHTTLINVFESLLKDESLVDVTLYAEGRPVRAHKVVLSACSPYFRAIFSAHSESHPVIILKDVLFAELRALVDYMYIGEVNVCQDQLASLIKTAESLNIKGLADGGSRKPPPPASPPPPPPMPPMTLPLPMSLPSQRLPLPPISLPLPPPPFPKLEQHVSARRSVSPHAVVPRSGEPPVAALLRPASASAALTEQLNGRASPPPAKKQRRPSGASAAGAAADEGEAASGGSPGGSPPPAAPAGDPCRLTASADLPERPQSAHSSPSLPRIPATITPLPTAAAAGGQPRPGSPLELDLSVRTSSAPPTSVKSERCRSSSGLSLLSDAAARSSEARAHAEDEVNSGDESEGEQPRDEDAERAGPSALPVGPPGSEPILPGGYMNWQLGGSDGGAPPPGEPGGPQDAFLHRALNVRFQQLLQQQRYDQLLGHAGAPVGPSPPAGLGLPLLLRRESPTSPCKQYACDKCGRQYASSGNLKRHVKYECGVEPQFQCPVCKKKFQHRHSVKIHVVSTHKTENPELIKDYLM